MLVPCSTKRINTKKKLVFLKIPVMYKSTVDPRDNKKTVSNDIKTHADLLKIVCLFFIFFSINNSYI